MMVRRLIVRMHHRLRAEWIVELPEDLAQLAGRRALEALMRTAQKQPGLVERWGGLRLQLEAPELALAPFRKPV